MFYSRRVLELQLEVTRLTAQLDSERSASTAALQQLRAQASRYEDMLVRVVDAALARHAAQSADLRPMTAVLASRAVEPTEELEGAVPAPTARRRYAEIHLGGLDESAALRKLADQEKAQLDAEEALAKANAEPDGD